MFRLSDHPLLLFIFSFIILWLSAHLGGVIQKRRRPVDEDLRQDFGFVLGASLTLLGLIIGFSFSMAAARYDERKGMEEAEANAIGTEYLRADLLPAADGANVRALLKSYLEQRILFYAAHDDQEAREIMVRTAQLESAMWSAVTAPAAERQTPVVALAVSGMNDVLNSQGYTQAAWWNRIPAGAWMLMAVIAIGCNFLVGFNARSVKTGSRFLLILPLLVAIALMLISDIDTPRRGIIRVSPQNLISLADSLGAK
jgi:hypothetical protein